MARLQHTVTVAALDRSWFEECAALLLDVVESTRTGPGGTLLEGGEPVPGVRLVKGRHLRAGARYTVTRDPAPPTPGEAPQAPVETLTTGIREWRRSTAIAVEQRVASADAVGRVTLRLRTPDRPSGLEAGCALRNPAGGFLQRISGRARIDLAAWWAAVAAPAGALPAARPPVSARARHPLGRADLSIAARPAGDGARKAGTDGRKAGAGAWEVGVTVTVRGRALLRPPAALVLLLFRVPLKRAFRQGIDETAARWNEVVEAGLPSPEELRAEFTEAVVTRKPGEAGPG
ncbi:MULTISPECIES: hypothetical protein [unclassified Streptomyces]|uniref:hypothetical protein n=1 Tax=unclassified Streptomyces TaxID=2593676 RepID=UPI00081BBCE0|nr:MULTISPECIES: hypothetical protein [unclassified Streptomyces]MYQ50534.1 hypothetical protein [Streptomyces sp. SID4941]SCD42345.1 hypothetical protein GA0115247_104322 [Streptomyces sp. PalvLS-984]SDD97096.1 hypothetical protein F558DRAFT_05248 [Streptomyces sp. AmelKG-A3]